jgi:hypothetical protein
MRASEIRAVIEGAYRSGDCVSLSAPLPGGGSLRATGVVRGLDDRKVEILEATGRLRRVPIRLIDDVRSTPERSHLRANLTHPEEE